MHEMGSWWKCGDSYVLIHMYAATARRLTTREQSPGIFEARLFSSNESQMLITSNYP